MSELPPSPLRRGILIGVGAGLAYGIASRFLFDDTGTWFGVMSLSFLVVVPMVIGYLTVRAHPSPSWAYRFFAPWVPTILSVVAAYAVGWEGVICIVMGLPLLLFFASIGGLLGAEIPARRGTTITALLLPLALAPLEHRFPAPASRRVVDSDIHIAAPAAAVWNQIIEVPTITRAERRPSLATAIGFPAPTSATLSQPGVGGIRHARFEGGVLFVETITDWEPERLLRFTIRAASDSVPVTTLDRHVVVGGPYIDVLTGTYRIVPEGDGVRLELTSELRVSTQFNLYAGPWADGLMQSIQRSILEVIRTRAEARP